MDSVLQSVIARWVLALEQFLMLSIRATWLMVGLGALFLSLSLSFQEVIRSPLQKLGFSHAAAVYQDFYPKTKRASGNLSSGKTETVQYEVDTVSLNGLLFGCSFINNVPLVGPIFLPALGMAFGHEWAEQQAMKK